MTSILATNNLRKVQHLLCLPSIAVRGLQTTATLSKKRIQAGVYKISKDRSIPLTYEEAKAPHKIGVEKSWLSWNTSNLDGENRQAESLSDDAFIRRFMKGTWHSMFASELVIKRRFNMIVIAGIIKKPRFTEEIYFLVGYTEEILTLLFKCPVKVEIQSVNDASDMIFKYI